MSLRDFARAFDQPCRDPFDQHDLMDGTGRDRGPWHGVVLRGLWVLGKSESAVLLDRLHADGAVRARTREDDSSGPLASIFGERAQEYVDHPRRSPSMALTRKDPFEILSSVPGAMTYTWSASTATPF